jgi:multidrug efflux pump subunit AcrA (membrane-fusion protein)
MGVRVGFLEPGRAAPPRVATPLVLVPADALRSDGGSSVVFVVADRKVSRRAVTVGKTVGPDREVLTGLKGGERVVVAPPASLSEGDTVRVAP